MQGDRLYNDVKNEICDRIYDGIFQEGMRIPAERTLSEQLGVSRITLRKAMEFLERDGLVTRQVGRGTAIQLLNRSVPWTMDMVVLIAPAQNPFFAGFIREFQQAGQDRGSMVLYVEKPYGKDLPDTLYQMYKKGLRNAVIWAEDLPMDREKLRRLRALGMNMVFFDTDLGLPYADCVALDNADAVGRLYQRLETEGYSRVAYIGWDNMELYSNRVREQAYWDATGRQAFFRLPWNQKAQVDELVFNLIRGQKNLPTAILCGDRECGASVCRALRILKRQDIQVASIDDFPEAAERNTLICRQDIPTMTEEIFHRLELQNCPSGSWSAEQILVPGIFID